MLLLGGSLSLCAQSKYPPIEELVYTGYYNWAGGFFVDDFRKISECRTFKSCGVFFTFLGLDIHDQGHPDIAF